MSPVWLPIAAVVLALLAAFAVVLRRSAVNGRRAASSPQGADPPPMRYQPMERLLDEADFRFLASQPDCDPAMVRRLRAERRRIFRSYLRHMQRDFNRVSGALAAILLTAAQDRPELSQELLRQKSRFAMAMLSAHFRLVLHGFGIGTVDASGMIGSLDALRAALGQLSAVPEAA